MKKFILSAAIIVIIAGISYVYLSSRQNEKVTEKSTKELTTDSAPTENGKATEKSSKELITELLSRKFSRPVNAVRMEVLIDKGAFTKGTYSVPGVGGGIWFAAKTATGWELASTGNGIASCDDISKYDFPKDMIPLCLDTKNNNNLIQR